MDPDEEDLLEAAKQGDWKAFEQLVRRCGQEVAHGGHGLVYHVCRQMLRDHDDPDEAANDAVQETLLRAFRSMSGFRGESSFCTWLSKIAKNVCLKTIKQRNQRNEATGPLKSLDEEGEEGESLKEAFRDGGPGLQSTVVNRNYARSLEKSIWAKAEGKWSHTDWEMLRRRLRGETWEEIAEALRQIEDHDVDYWRSRYHERIKPVLDEVCIEEVMREKALGRWRDHDLQLFSARVVRGKELGQLVRLLGKLKGLGSDYYRGRIQPVLEAVRLEAAARATAVAQAEQDKQWTAQDLQLFRCFLMEGQDYAAIAKHLGKDKKQCREWYHARIKEVVVEAFHELDKN